MENLPLPIRDIIGIPSVRMRETLKILMEALARMPGLTEAELSRAAGRDSSYFQKLKTGKVGDPGVRTLVKLAAKLGIEGPELLEALRRDLGIEGAMAHRKESLIRLIEDMNPDQLEEMFPRAAEIAQHKRVRSAVRKRDKE